MRYLHQVEVTRDFERRGHIVRLELVLGDEEMAAVARALRGDLPVGPGPRARETLDAVLRALSPRGPVPSWPRGPGRPERPALPAGGPRDISVD